MTTSQPPTGDQPRRRARRTILVMCETCHMWTRNALTDAPPDSTGRHEYRCRGCGREVRR